MKKKMKKKTKRIIIITLIIIFILMIIIISQNRKKQTETEYDSLKQLLESFDCTYIKEQSSKFKNVETDIYLKFGKDLYQNGESNERYFIDIVQTVAKFKLYENFALIDEDKQIEIIAFANEDKTMVTRIYINGDSNYFGNHNSQTALSKQKEEKNTNMQIASSQLRSLIQNDWERKDVNFGTRETIYNDYWYYFDEGIEVKTIAAKVYNIIFKTNYKNEVLKGITTNMSQDVIINILGTPTYGKKGDNVIGYKGNDIYVFFSNQGISIYPNENYATKDFINVVKNIPENMSVNELLDKITDIWKDYDKYIYNLENYICLRYSLKGVQIQFNMEDNNGIVFYNNYNGEFGDGLTRKSMQEDSSKIPNNFYFDNQNLIYLAELERYNEEELIRLPEGYSNMKRQQVKDFYYTLDTRGEIQKNLRVISKTGKFADCDVELDVQILSVLWINDETLAYSVKGGGIYIYNSKDYTKKNVLETNEDCKLVKYENGKLYYNNTSIEIK